MTKPALKKFKILSDTYLRSFNDTNIIQKCNRGIWSILTKL